MTATGVGKYDSVYLCYSPNRNDSSQPTAVEEKFASLSSVDALHQHHASGVKLTSRKAPSLRRARQASIWPFMLDNASKNIHRCCCREKRDKNQESRQNDEAKLMKNSYSSRSFFASMLLSIKQQCLRQTRRDLFSGSYELHYLHLSSFAFWSVTFARSRMLVGAVCAKL